MSIPSRAVSNRRLAKHLVGAVLEAKAINLYFADFKSLGSNYDKTPDVVGLQYVGGNTTVKLVRGLKVPLTITSRGQYST